MPAAGPQSAAVLPAAIQRFLEVSLYALVLTGFATLASTGSLDLPTVLFTGSALALRGYLLATRQTLIIPERATALLTIGYAIFYLADFFFISGAFINATVHLVLFVMVVRLFSAQRDRDFYFLSIIAFLMVLAAAVLTVDSVFLVMFAGFALVAVVTVILMEIKGSAAKASVHSKDPNERQKKQSLARLLVGAAVGIVLMIVFGAAAIFFLLPRVSSGYFSAFAPRNQFAAGFSDQVQLGGIGEIQQSSAVVMHIRIDNDSGGRLDLKWRGLSLSAFDGKTWSNPREHYVAPRLPEGNFAVGFADPNWHVANSAPRIHYRVLMEPIGTNVFFLAVTPLELRGNYRVVGMDGRGGVFDLDSEHPIGTYEAWSNITVPEAAQLRQGRGLYPPRVESLYLQLPAIDARIRSLAEQITSGANNNYDKAAAIEAYLQTQFGYTLQLPSSEAGDPLANFLFDRKQGHCEYFASAMAVMLRSLGIPSRIVNGFRAGEFNDLTSQYIVRASNAHSWVEAYFPGSGWISFDPTPPSAIAPAGGWNRAMLYLDAMRSFWREWVVNYDLSHQQALGQEAARASRQSYYRLRRWYHVHYRELVSRARQVESGLLASPWRTAVTATLAVGLTFLLLNAARLGRGLRRRRLAANPDKSPSLAAAIWYERMIRAMAKRGWSKKAVQTPAEFLDGIQDSAMRMKVARFTFHYEAARFGDSPGDAQQLPELFREISVAARR